MSDAIASAKTDAYKTVYIVTNSDSAAAGDIRNLMNTYAPPTVSGASSTYECGNIPDSKVGFCSFKILSDTLEST